MAVTPNAIVTPQSIQSDQNVVTAAKTTYADGANAVLLATAGANGSIVYAITAMPRGSLSAAAKLMLFKSTDGTNLAYINAIVVPAYTDAATTAPPQASFGYSETVPLRLKANERLYIGIYAAAANGIQVDCQMENL